MRPVNRDIAITGTGAVTPLGVGAEALTTRWLAGETGIVEGRAVCADFEPHDFMSRLEVECTDRFVQLAVAAVDQAVEEAGWGAVSPYAPDRVACIVGTGAGGLATMEEQADRLSRRGPDGVSPSAAAALMPSSAAAIVAMRHRWLGPSFAVCSCGATGGYALGAAMRMVATEEVDAAVVAASESTLTGLGLGSLAAADALSPSGESVPFDARRDGVVLGEGAGAVVIEPIDLARGRGAPVLAEVLGFGSTTDGYRLSATDPQARGAARAMELALHDAGVAPDELDYVKADGSGSRAADRAETVALKQALGHAVEKLPVSSAKSAIGHLLGAAGVVEAVGTVHALRRGMAPPTVGYEVPDEELDLDYVPASRVLRDSRNGSNGAPFRALVNAFGLGGQNAVVCLSICRRRGTRRERSPSAG
ncbi:MAG TPA: beta-ketoacyl synthase N-terminal-like domain-containing protein [Thermoleophilaceae bacterium]